MYCIENCMVHFIKLLIPLQVALIEGLLHSASSHQGRAASHSPAGQGKEERLSADAAEDGQTVQVATVDSFQVTNLSCKHLPLNSLILLFQNNSTNIPMQESI